jgi:hypothetical protein
VDSQTAFVARLDATGATRWAYTLPYLAWKVSAIEDGDGALTIGGVPEDGSSYIELHMIRVTSTGDRTEVPLGSSIYGSNADIDGMYSNGAGRLTAVIDLYPESAYEEELTIGWHRLVSGRYGRRYLVEMAR